ncbi:hypothetical protein L198_00915 [Cryptococcus wingfieldii CBS 7118]|uniref:Kinase n=1 Tax=Cryptococcus wingfieldii CBS 7118 TaxID=1295528 RepID=A0A1E3K2U4_9TREE|nr:hypothetical protein L198_00915 [Cryptococcus wingfieldii CBS 7118]ODO07336.1 hypothetical protein L198_00915 [Cryptococcus wingfieldii CBS 7118]
MDTSPDGEWLYKATWYEAINDPEYMKEHPELESLEPFIPAYKGWVERSSYVRSETPASSRRGSNVSSSHKLGDMVPKYGKDGQIVGYKPNGADKYTKSIIISNRTHGLRDVTVADFKLGTRLYGPLASPEKRARQDATTAESTSGSKGVLYAGGTTWLPSRECHVFSDDRFSRTLNDDTLASAAACVFPSIRDLALPSEYVVAQEDEQPDLDLEECREKEQDMLNRTRTALQLLPKLSEAIQTTGLDFPGTSALIIHGKSVEDDTPEVRLAFVDFAHTHQHDEDMSPDGVLFGIQSTMGILREQEAALERSLAALDNDRKPWNAWGSDAEEEEGEGWNAWCSDE